MKGKQIISFIFYSLCFFSFIALLKSNMLIYMFSIFPIAFILFKKYLSKYPQEMKNILLFLISFLFYQTLFPINLTQSLSRIQLILLSHSEFAIILVSFLLAFLIYFVFQEKIQVSFTNTESLAIHSVKILQLKKENYTNLYSESKTKLNRKNIQYLIKDIPRHGYLKYTSQRSLSEEYFKLSEYSIQEEERLYIILSNTGSPASEIISLFTHEEYNHLSLSFDRSLYTMISYNGGNDYQNPGLNSESLSNLNQKEDSQLLVYSLIANRKEKEIILNKIKQINEEGSAYNVIGLLTNVSVRSNMMYCSQFVYLMLEEVELNFFEVGPDQIKPTDFIDYDFNEALKFEYKINFSELKKQLII